MAVVNVCFSVIDRRTIVLNASFREGRKSESHMVNKPFRGAAISLFCRGGSHGAPRHSRHTAHDYGLRKRKHTPRGFQKKKKNDNYT
jgi:hypothetical protein